MPSSLSLSFSELTQEDVPRILPLVSALNEGRIDEAILSERLTAMWGENYTCMGCFDRDKLIGVAGLWLQTRHYVGKSCELDHVYLLPAYRGKGVGEKFMDFIHQWTKEKGCQSTELYAYVTNPKSHKFYFNQGYAVLGFHFQRKIDHE